MNQQINLFSASQVFQDPNPFFYLLNNPDLYVQFVSSDGQLNRTVYPAADATARMINAQAVLFTVGFYLANHRGKSVTAKVFNKAGYGQLKSGFSSGQAPSMGGMGDLYR
jgi:hypothetical protein